MQHIRRLNVAVVSVTVTGSNVEVKTCAIHSILQAYPEVGSKWTVAALPAWRHYSCIPALIRWITFLSDFELPVQKFHGAAPGAARISTPRIGGSNRAGQNKSRAHSPVARGRFFNRCKHCCVHAPICSAFYLDTYRSRAELLQPVIPQSPRDRSRASFFQNSHSAVRIQPPAFDRFVDVGYVFAGTRAVQTHVFDMVLQIRQECHC